ncbi:MAG TPA: group II intron reverse transcriptase/maturase [Hyphomicrobiaceae bacterium]|nr:group II intron reverse transcriptase/maturase [Hyphomicrobiaceae bacterium]
MAETSGSTTVSTKLERIAKLAKQMPEKAMTSLSHHIDADWLREAYRLTRKDGAVGVDEQTAAQYAAQLESNLESLLDRAKSGDRYSAPPVRRVHIPKGDGSKTRPIGIPTFEDKVLQRAVTMALEAVYEQDFLDCSYGFRPGRGAHGALDALWRQSMSMKANWVLELDIEKFFDTIDRGQLREVLQKRVRDGVILRLIGKWLNAGVMEEGVVYHPKTGTPQGGVISPLLANVFLHEVLDLWFEQEVKPRLKGKAFLIRYADDAVAVFELETDARKVLEVLPKRFGKYGLRLHPEKTRLVRFHRPKKAGRNDDPPPPPPESFDLLGFTHHWGRSRKGNWVIQRKTAMSRFSRARQRISMWCRANRHLPIREQHAMLRAKLRGHDAYYGITGNGRSLSQLRYWVTRDWLKWLRRQSRAAARRNWEWMERLLRVFPLPPPRVVHSVLPTAAKP